MAHGREADVERTIVFSDGVVAIAITLLILSLTEIHPAEHATLADIVVENSAALGAFALSFAVIANYWTIHRDLFGPLRRYNRRIGLLNMFWLAAIGGGSMFGCKGHSSLSELGSARIGHSSLGPVTRDSNLGWGQSSSPELWSSTPRMSRMPTEENVGDAHDSGARPRCPRIFLT
jgi:Endosomal/lysosomal potassium channel TMEM175